MRWVINPCIKYAGSDGSKSIELIIVGYKIIFLCTDVMVELYNYVNPLNKRHSPMISKETLDIILENKAVSHN